MAFINSNEEMLQRELDDARDRFHRAFEEYGRLLNAHSRIEVADAARAAAISYAQEAMTEARRHYEASLKTFTDHVA
jgi:hypothetical protein